MTEFTTNHSVYEALVDLLFEDDSFYPPGEDGECRLDVNLAALGIQDKFDVRLKGLWTEAEVESAANAICWAAENAPLDGVRMEMRKQYMREAWAALHAVSGVSERPQMERSADDSRDTGTDAGFKRHGTEYALEIGYDDQADGIIFEISSEDDATPAELQQWIPASRVVKRDVVVTPWVPVEPEHGAQDVPGFGGMRAALDRLNVRGGDSS